MGDTSPFFPESRGRAQTPTITRHPTTLGGLSRASAAANKCTKPDFLPAEFQNCSKIAPNTLSSLYLNTEREEEDEEAKKNC